MKRLLAGVPLLFVLACEDAATTAPCDVAPAQPAQPAASGDSPALKPAIREVATSTAKIERVKLRVDEAGVIVKQSVYHDDASAIPEAVRKLAEQQFPGSTPISYETEHYADLGDIYEVELNTADGQQCEVAGRADGSLVYTECRLDPASMPEPIAAQVSAAIPGGEVVEAERKTRDGSEEFTVEVTHDGREFYLRIAADGSLLSKHVRLPALLELPVP
ncbi:hypothetical protein [Enhygromyxa salina]|uniref:Beta-lactamase-inhibitor-like PepSY-like domain-containing protein n=1 Tax=Enhygromyxa salina TaxID=215803 RepID=A0A2S9YMB6_9BACT|nr:hypothetical protein [Enhygromyxa salina]PRQ06230.1 hypothetical protein ENSA7_40780 [Enhygromyxa salina]